MTSASVCISNRFSVFENVCNLCDCVRSVCPHTNLINTFTSSMIRNSQNDNMGTPYLNAQMTLNVQKQTCAETLEIKNTDLQLSLSEKRLIFRSLEYTGYLWQRHV